MYMDIQAGGAIRGVGVRTQMGGTPRECEARLR
jgi:hypothetical protein